MKLNRIKAVLSEKGISQTWLAKKLDKSFSMVNAYACIDSTKFRDLATDSKVLQSI